MERNTINNSALNILVIGTGMYVCGRGTNSYGTVLPAIYEWKRHVGSVNVYITGASSEGINAIKKKIEELNNLDLASYQNTIVKILLIMRLILMQFVIFQNQPVL